MTTYAPLVFDPVRGIPVVLDSADTLAIGHLQLANSLALFTGPGNRGATRIQGDWDETVSALVQGLVSLGLLDDHRSSSWADGINAAGALSRLGPYEPGRLIIGGMTGWQVLDQPAILPGVIQAVTAHAGPPETLASGRSVQQLGYCSLISIGARPAAAGVSAGSLWFDTSVTPAALRIHDGRGWQPVLAAALQSLLAPAADGSLQVAAPGGYQALPPGPVGAMLTPIGPGSLGWTRWFHQGSTAPWPAGASAAAPGRPAAATAALWLEDSTAGSRLSVWDEVQQQWLGVPVANGMLDAIAGLRPAAGDLLAFAASGPICLPAGKAGDRLVSSGGAVAFRSVLHDALVAPVAAFDGELWEDSDHNAYVWVHDRWEPLGGEQRHRAVNATSQPLLAGQFVTLTAAGWVLGQPIAQSAPLLCGVVLEDAAAGASTLVQLSGVVALSAAAWSRAMGTSQGLRHGALYGVTAANPGTPVLLVDATAGVVVGQAISQSVLLLGVRSIDPASQVLRGAAPPVALRDGQLWLSDTDVLSAWDAGRRQWLPIGGPGLLPPPATVVPAPPAAVAVTAVEVIDVVTDPRAAGLRFHFSDGSTQQVIFRGAGSAAASMSDAGTMVIAAAAAAGGGSSSGGSIDGGVVT